MQYENEAGEGEELQVSLRWETLWERLLEPTSIIFRNALLIFVMSLARSYTAIIPLARF